MGTDVRRRTGWAAVVAGALFFLGQGGELVFGDDTDLLFGVLVALLAAAIVAFLVAFIGLRTLLAESRLGRTGATVGAVGGCFLVAFAVQLAVAAVRTGEVPENFVLFGLGFLLVVVAHMLLLRPLRALVGGAHWLSAVAGVALLVALFVHERYIWHDIALFVFEASWVTLGWRLLRRSAAHAGPHRHRPANAHRAGPK